MIRTLTRIACIAALIFTASRTHADAQPDAGEAPGPASDAAFDSLTYSDSGGFAGHGSGKFITLASDGSYEIRKTFPPNQDDPVKGKLTDEELVTLNQLIAAVDWKNIKPHYPSRGADMFQNDLSVTLAGEKYTTSCDDHFHNAPASLAALMRHLDTLHRKYRPAKK